MEYSLVDNSSNNQLDTTSEIELDPDVGLREIRELIPKLHSELVNSEYRETFLSFFDQQSKIVMVTEEQWGVPENWFFIGDIHGDFFALYNILNSIKIRCEDFRIVFLGDMIDRGKYSVECVFLLLSWAKEYPNRIVWIAGNHDIALKIQEVNDDYQSSVSPAEILDFINESDALIGFRHEIGKLLVQISSRLPRALLFPDGLMATHGGFPLADLQEQGKLATDFSTYMDWLNSTACLQDFTWTRITKYRKRMPNRMSTGCSYGFMDFESFCELQPNLFPVKRMITGHEHPDNGWLTFTDYQKNPAVTITGFGYEPYYTGPADLPPYRPTLLVGRYLKDALPEKIEIEFSIEHLKKFYPVINMENSHAST